MPADAAAAPNLAANPLRVITLHDTAALIETRSARKRRITLRLHVRMPTRRDIFSAALGLSSWRLLCAQDEAVFTTNVKVVNVLATVRAKNGSLVSDLSKDDFSLSENGHPQNIRYFARETDLPLTLGLLIDTSGSQRRVLDSERGASVRFLDQVVRDKTDKVFIMQFDSAVDIKQPLTSKVGQLDDALAYVDTETKRQIQLQNGGGTLLYDAVKKASDDVMKPLTGRKALILLTDGVDLGSNCSVDDAIESAQRADTLIYSILYSDPGAYGLFGGGHDGKRVLERLSGETGGSYFEVTKKEPVDKAYEILQQELRTQYNLGYVSDTPVTLSEFRAIQLNVAHKGLTVQARKRYWAQR
jgi:VWFA-related protein